MSRPALTALADAGWRNVILSNHVPELPRPGRITGARRPRRGRVHLAAIGFDKPYPEAFRHALRAMGEPARCWMVGDNPEADVRGAKALGIPALLVRTAGP